MNKKGYLYLCVSIFAFSTIEFVSKFIVNDFHPVQLNFLRFLIGGIILLPFSLMDIKRRKVKFNLKDIAMLMVLGILAVPISMSLLQLAVPYINASVLAVIISANPVFVAPFSYLVLKEKSDRTVIISLIMGLTGMAIIALPALSVSNSSIIGIGLGIASAITFALFSVLGKMFTPKMGGLVMNNMVFLSGSVFMLPVMAAFNIPVFKGITLATLPYLLYLGIVVTAIGYIFLFKGLALLPANKGTLVFFIKPFLAGSLAYLVLKESISISLIVGTLFILGGLFITITQGSRMKLKEIGA